jgi:hypothetical protein
MLLNSRVQRSIIPVAEYANFIDCREVLRNASEQAEPAHALERALQH